MILSNKGGGGNNNDNNKRRNPNYEDTMNSFGSFNMPVGYAETDQFFNEPQQQNYQQPNFYNPVNYNNPASQQAKNDFFEMPQQLQQQSPSSSIDFQTNQNSAFYNPKQTYAPPMPNYQAPPQQQQQQPPQQPQQFFNPMVPNGMENFINDPVASVAFKYGSTLADQGKDYVAQNVDKWFSVSKLKYYFAVDTTYVAKKLMIILFPYLNRDWSVKYAQEDAVPPKLDVNAPDMYIPVMAFVTYILMVGVCLGIQEKFTPEVLGIQASSALGWFVIEVFLVFLSLQVLSIKSALKTFDIMAFCGYKYFGMILCLGTSVVVPQFYHIVLIYMCLSITYFMVRNLKLLILTSHAGYDNMSLGNKRRVYVLLFISLLQPIFMWWLTRHLVPSSQK